MNKGFSSIMKDATREYIKNTSHTYNYECSGTFNNNCLINNHTTLSQQQQSKHFILSNLSKNQFPPLSFYHRSVVLEDCFAAFKRNTKTEEECLKALRTKGTVVYGHVLKQNERGIFIKVMYMRVGVINNNEYSIETSGKAIKRWDVTADVVSNFSSCNVFCKNEDMEKTMLQKQNPGGLINETVVAIVKDFKENAANRVDVSMLNDEYNTLDLQEILSIPKDATGYKFKKPLGILTNNTKSQNVNDNISMNNNNGVTDTKSCVTNIQQSVFFKNPKLGIYSILNHDISPVEDVGRNSMLGMKRPFHPELYYNRIKNKQSRHWAEGRVAKGNEEMETESYERAVIHYKEAIHLDPTYPEAFKHLIVAMRTINKRDNKHVYSHSDIAKEEKKYMEALKLCEESNQTFKSVNMQTKSPIPFGSTSKKRKSYE